MSSDSFFFDLSPLVDCELHTVVVGRNFLLLNFLKTPHLVDGKFRNDGCSVQIDSGFLLERDGVHQAICEQSTMLAASGSLTSALIDGRIENAGFGENNNLVLEFDGGFVLTVLVDESGYESYSVDTPGDNLYGVSITSNIALKPDPR